MKRTLICIGLGCMLVLSTFSQKAFTQSSLIIDTSTSEDDFHTEGVCVLQGVQTCKILKRVRIAKVGEYGPGINPAVPNGGGLYVIWNELKSGSVYGDCRGCGGRFEDGPFLLLCPTLFTGSLGTGTGTFTCSVAAGGVICGVSDIFNGLIVDSKNAQLYVYIPTGYASIQIRVVLTVTRNGNPRFSGGYELTFDANPDPSFVGDMDVISCS